MALKYISLLLLLGACASAPSYNDDHVTVNAALNIAKTAYVKGCVRALNKRGIKNIMLECRRDADNHIKDIHQIMEQ